MRVEFRVELRAEFSVEFRVEFGVALRSNERRRHVTSEAKGPTAPQAHAVCNASEAKQ